MLGRGLYSQPYFLRESAGFIGEWVYVGQQGTGVTPHIDHLCMAKWSYQVTGCKRWQLRSSTPHLHPHLGGLLTDELCAGETLVFWPDHVHSTRCSSPVCISLHGYIALEWQDNCYLQSMLDEAERLQNGGQQQRGEDVDSFVRHRSAGSAAFQPTTAPLDYASKCPPHYLQHTRHCNAINT